MHRIVALTSLLILTSGVIFLSACGQILPHGYMVLAAVLMFYAVLFLLIASYRGLARTVLSSIWKKWYVRRAIDLSIVGFFLLILSMAIDHSGYRLEESLGQDGYRLALEKQPKDLWKLSNLLGWAWFVDNFGNYVIFPPLSLAAIGFAIERTWQKRSDAAGLDAKARQE